MNPQILIMYFPISCWGEYEPPMHCCAAGVGIQLPFHLNFSQYHQNGTAAPVDWEAAAKQYSAHRVPSQQQEEQHQQKEAISGKRKRTSKVSNSVANDAADEDEVFAPDGYTERRDEIGELLKQADQAPYSYEALQALVSALSAADPERLDEYESALERLLFEFPLLFGYWKKLAKLQCDKKGDWNKCEEVFERSLEFVGHNPLIWTAYFEWMHDFASLPPHLIRARMDQAIERAGAHWKAWPLWQSILDWEEEELFTAREKIISAEQGIFKEEPQGSAVQKFENKCQEREAPESLTDINRARMQTALERLRMLYFQLLRTPLEASDLSWERLKTLVEKGSRSSIKSRRGPRLGGNSEGPFGDGGSSSTKGGGPSTLFDVYDLLGDELLPQLLQRLQQQKSTTLQDLQLAIDAAATAEQVSSADPAAERAAIKEKGKPSNAAIDNAAVAKGSAYARQCAPTSPLLCAACSVSLGLPECCRQGVLAAVEGVARCNFGAGRTEKTLRASGQYKQPAINTHRWFWHPDPLAPRRLCAWREYLDFEEKNAPERLDLLQRRCLEVCACYPEFWLRCAKQRKQKSVDDALSLLEFGTTKVLKRRRDMACVYASQLEACGRFKEAAREFEALVRPPMDAASLKYFVALLQFSLRHPPETATDGLSHALLLLQEAADKYRDNAPCAELIHLYRAKLVAFHEGDTKKALCILARARESLPKSLPLLLLQLRLQQQQHAGDPQKILSACRHLLSDVLSNSDADVWLRWQVLKLQIHLCEFYGASTETLYAARDAATAFLEKHKEEIDALLANVELRRLPQQLLLPYGEKENEGPTVAAASATDWCNGESQASAEVSVFSSTHKLLSPAAAATAAAASPAAAADSCSSHPLAWSFDAVSPAAACSHSSSTACCSRNWSSVASSYISTRNSIPKEASFTPSALLITDDGILQYLHASTPSFASAAAAGTSAAASGVCTAIAERTPLWPWRGASWQSEDVSTAHQNETLTTAKATPQAAAIAKAIDPCRQTSPAVMMALTACIRSVDYWSSSNPCSVPWEDAAAAAVSALHLDSSIAARDPLESAEESFSSTMPQMDAAVQFLAAEAPASAVSEDCAVEGGVVLTAGMDAFLTINSSPASTVASDSVAATEETETSSESLAVSSPQRLPVKQLIGRHIAEAGRGLSFMRSFSLHNLRVALECGSLCPPAPEALKSLSFGEVVGCLCYEAAAASLEAAVCEWHRWQPPPEVLFDAETPTPAADSSAKRLGEKAAVQKQDDSEAKAEADRARVARVLWGVVTPSSSQTQRGVEAGKGDAKEEDINPHPLPLSNYIANSMRKVARPLECMKWYDAYIAFRRSQTHEPLVPCSSPIPTLLRLSCVQTILQYCPKGAGRIHAAAAPLPLRVERRHTLRREQYSAALRHGKRETVAREAKTTG
ncbi:uncharacterized protein LOC34621405 [Cyclospora cayetanensis]|uniref:Uncharacterized protein LOC34621405 n=1 Tax=Cyclospora cayetanensis TaxID=88456 RepID=A0A6P6RPQ7_9EIME|nr:uncharacterized protein LOC34621405 [Cyclospora cayetanensis]